MHDPHGQILQIVREKMDPATAEIIAAAFHDAHRLTVIRDAFMEEKDALAVKMIRDLDPNEQGFRRLLPAMSSGTLIHPGQSAQITARPQCDKFTVISLLVARSCAEAFMINDLRVGNRSQQMQAGDVPAEIFAIDAPLIENLPEPDADGFITIKINKPASDRSLLELDFDLCLTAMDLVLIVTNTSSTPREFRAAWYGKTPTR